MSKSNSTIKPDLLSLKIFFQDKKGQGYVVNLKNNEAKYILDCIELAQDGSIKVSLVNNLKEMSIEEVRGGE